MSPCSRRDDAPRSSTPWSRRLDATGRRRARTPTCSSSSARLRAVPEPQARARVRRRPARPADDRGRRPRSVPADRAATLDARLTVAAAPHRPRPPDRRRRRRLRPRRCDHLDGGGRPERPARRRPLPAQARHRERPDRRPASATTPRARRCSANASGRLAEVDAADPRRRPRTPTIGRRHPRHLHRPGHRGLRPAARRLRRSTGHEPRSTELRDFTASSLDQLSRARAAGARRRPRRAARRRPGRCSPDRRRGAEQPAPTCGGTASPTIPPPLAPSADRHLAGRPAGAPPAQPSRHRRRQAPDQRPASGDEPARRRPPTARSQPGRQRSPATATAPTDAPARRPAPTPTGATGGTGGRQRQRRHAAERRRPHPGHGPSTTRSTTSSTGSSTTSTAAAHRTLLDDPLGEPSSGPLTRRRPCRLSGRRTPASSAASRASAGWSRAPGR